MDNIKPINTVHHYCSMQSFYNIFKGKEFWISDIFKMNDYNEMVILLDDFEDIIAEEFKKAPFELTITPQVEGKTTVINPDEVISLIKELYGNWKYDFTKNDSMEYKIFIACFSEKNDVLSQWGMYADNAQGVSIGFNVAPIIKLTKENSNFQFIKVKYINKEEKRSIQENLASNYLEAFKQNFPKNLANLVDEPEKMKQAGYDITYHIEDFFHIAGRELYERCFLELLKKSIEYKSDYFVQEAEWRLIYIPKSNYWDKEPETKEEKEEYNLMRYRLSGNSLVKYISLPLEKIIKNPQMNFYESGEIDGDMTPNFIVRGPRNHNGMCEIIDFLTIEGFSFFSKSSEISYR